VLIGEGLWFRHGRHDPWLLAGVDISVAPGRVVGLRGPSGCGKSTLATVLSGLRTPHRGAVSVDGAGLGARGPRRVQLVTQRPETAIDPRWRIRRALAEAGRHEDGDDGLVEPTWLDRYPHEISGGELQRVNLARALRARPAYIVADEISSSLDALTQAMLWDHLLDRVQRDGLGVLAISHDQALLGAVADRIVDMPTTERRTASTLDRHSRRQ
jgi:ABC-type dipeptide/oligopeptide/nickel transport system ATPase subunit